MHQLPQKETAANLDEIFHRQKFLQKHRMKIEEIISEKREPCEESKHMEQLQKFHLNRQRITIFTEREKQVQIQKENDILLTKLLDIQTRSPSPKYSARSLGAEYNMSALKHHKNYVIMKNEVAAVIKKNGQIAKRIISQESNIDHRQLERDFQKNLGYKNNIRKFNPNIDQDDTLKNLRGIEFHVQAEQEQQKYMSLPSSNVSTRVTTSNTTGLFRIRTSSPQQGKHNRDVSPSSPRQQQQQQQSKSPSFLRQNQQPTVNAVKTIKVPMRNQSPSQNSNSNNNNNTQELGYKNRNTLYAFSRDQKDIFPNRASSTEKDKSKQQQQYRPQEKNNLDEGNNKTSNSRNNQDNKLQLHYPQYLGQQPFLMRKEESQGHKENKQGNNKIAVNNYIQKNKQQQQVQQIKNTAIKATNSNQQLLSAPKTNDNQEEKNGNQTDKLLNKYLLNQKERNEDIQDDQNGQQIEEDDKIINSRFQSNTQNSSIQSSNHSSQKILEEQVQDQGQSEKPDVDYDPDTADKKLEISSQNSSSKKSPSQSSSVQTYTEVKQASEEELETCLERMCSLGQEVIAHAKQKSKEEEELRNNREKQEKQQQQLIQSLNATRQAARSVGYLPKHQYISSEEYDEGLYQKDEEDGEDEDEGEDDEDYEGCQQYLLDQEEEYQDEVGDEEEEEEEEEEEQEEEEEEDQDIGEQSKSTQEQQEKGSGVMDVGNVNLNEQVNLQAGVDENEEIYQFLDSNDGNDEELNKYEEKVGEEGDSIHMKENQEQLDDSKKIQNDSQVSENLAGEKEDQEDLPRSEVGSQKQISKLQQRDA